jgi:hypothetical protein
MSRWRSTEDHRERAGVGVIRSTRLGLLLSAIVVALVLSTASPGRVAADGAAVRFPGRVSWIAGETMVISTDDGVALSVDLAGVPQDEYQRLASGDRVLVIGALGRNRIVATTIRSLDRERHGERALKTRAESHDA